MAADEPEKLQVDRGVAMVTTWFLQNSLDAFVCLRDGAIAWANGSWTTITGWSAEQTIGRPYADFLFREQADAAMADIADLPPLGRGVFTHEFASKSRGRLWLRCHAVRGDNGWVLVILRDVTVEHQRAQEDEQARRIASMVRSTAGVIPWRYDAENDRYEIDPDFTAPDELSEGQRKRSGDSQRRSIHPDDVAAVTKLWHRSLSTGEPGEIEYRMRMGGAETWTRTRTAWQGLKQGPSGRWDILGVSADITEIADARDAALRGEQAALAAAQAKSTFLANVSHELRTPMNGVLGILRLIRHESSAARRRGMVDQALASGVGLSDLLNDIVDFADVEAGRLELEAEPIDPAEQLASIIAMFKPQADAKSVVLSTRVGGDIGWVAADPARLRKLMFHLVSNAVKFTHAGRIEARLSANGEGEARRLRLEVEDTGVGVDPAHADRLFQQFSQADSSITREYGGPGLGLAVTRGLAEMMGGAVGYESERGKGSTFWVEVSAPAASAPANDAGDGVDWLSGVKVLVVEDNATNRLVATQMLGQLGAEVSTADNGAEGVAAMERGDFDLVFMDIQMPVMDGVEATRRIRAMPSPKGQVPIVATTANVMPEQLAAYRQNGIDGVVAKPISPAALITEVARLANAEAA